MNPAAGLALVLIVVAGLLSVVFTWLRRAKRRQPYCAGCPACTTRRPTNRR